MYIVMADVVVADTGMTYILMARLAIVFDADLYSYGLYSRGRYSDDLYTYGPSSFRF